MLEIKHGETLKVQIRNLMCTSSIIEVRPTEYLLSAFINEITFLIRQTNSN